MPIKIQSVNIDSLTVNPSNPRVIKDDKYNKLVQSIKNFPKMLEIRPIVVNAEMMILGGNMRLRACKDAGLKEVPVIQAEDLTDDEQKEFIIKDNVGFGEWDWDMIANEWDAELIQAWGLDIPDFALNKDVQEDDYEIPDEIQTDIVLGDLFEIGEHRLLCGDSTNSDDVAEFIREVGSDLVTDPPYGLGIDGQKKSTAKNPKHNRKAHEFRGWDYERPDKSTFASLISFVQNSVIWGGNYFADILPASRGWLYWSKGQDGLTMSDGELAWTSLQKPLRSITANRAQLHDSKHPTQKPVIVMAFSINYIHSNNVIFDPFIGSGTTMVAAHQLNRKCYGMEIDPKYCQVIIDRMLKLCPELEIKRNGEVYDYQPENSRVEA